MSSSIANNEQERSENGKVNDLDNFLLERQKPNSAMDKVVHNSQEKISINRKNSADADSMSRIQKETKLNDYLKQKRRRKKKRLTISVVNAQTANILEEFLQAQLLQHAIQTSSPEYQRVVEVDVTETTTPSGDTSSNFASSSNILREDSIPFADESDHEMRKTESLPHDVFTELPSEVGGKGLPVYHEKSKSAPYSQDDEDGWMHESRKKLPGSINPPPPPPPGTPHTPSDQGSNGSHSQLRPLPPVPYTGKPTGYTGSQRESLDRLNHLERRHSPAKKRSPPRAPDTLTLPASNSSHSHSSLADIDHDPTSANQKDFSQSPKIQSCMKPMKLRHSGSITSSDTDDADSHNTRGRKKKSMFKKAQERLQILLRVKKMRPADHEHMEYEGRESLDKKRPSYKKKSKKRNKDMSYLLDLADTYEPEYDGKVLEDRYIHTNKHILQTHTGGDDLNVVRSEDGTEHVFIVNDREETHIDKRWKMKESSNHGDGLFGKLRRLTSREKKNKIKGSKSAQFEKDASQAEKSKYSRAISVPVQDEERGLDGNLKLYDNERGFAFSNVGSEDLGHNRRRITGTQITCGDEGQDEGLQWNSSHLDIVDHSGQMIERLCFDADGMEMPTNKSFSYEQDGYIHEQRVDHHGHIRIIKDTSQTSHIEFLEDEDDGYDDMEEKSEHSNMTEADREELYGRIASRLANIGDNMMTEKEQSRSESTTPRSKLTDDQNSSPEQEITKTKLTPLEVELRDELRKVADDMDAMLEANMKRAALHISGLVTYNHFKNIVQDSVDNKVGWAQVAAVFHITKRAMRLAGDSGALAMHIKEMSLKYIADRFAGWIVGQGGWDSMLSEDELETDSELD